ncbi:MAG: Fe-S cluster assembly protein IscX [Anaerolineae bacterium]|nr:Fe-S cluster assembly protein IscX [Thermoflexales bacterium]MDW8396382.1 Fe-S cluster assembly protein IscX [Anaerolineae bacterium]
MASPLYWDDAYPIALALNQRYPEVEDPTEVSLGVLHRWVVQLEGFSDDPQRPAVEWLEDIQTEWVELKLASSLQR